MKHFIIISRNPRSYLSGHSIFSWQLSTYLLSLGNKITHLVNEPFTENHHNTVICESIIHENYNYIEPTDYTNHKIPTTQKSCLVADYIDKILSDNPDSIVLAISPLSYLADVSLVCESHQTKIICFMRGTDTLILKTDWCKTPSGIRYFKALNASFRVYGVSNYIKDLAQSMNLKMDNVIYPTNYLPYKKTLNTSLKLNQKHQSPIISIIGRFSNDKGILEVATIIEKLFLLDSSFLVYFVGSGGLKKEIEQKFDNEIYSNRVWVGELSFRDVIELAESSWLLLAGSGMNFSTNFREAIGNSNVLYSSSGVPILFSKNNIGGINESVGDTNKKWCESIENANNMHLSIVSLKKNISLWKKMSVENAIFSEKFKIQNILKPFLESITRN